MTSLRRLLMAGAGGAGATDPHIANVVHLLHFDGVDASTTFTDSRGPTWTAGGNAQLDTAQSKYGSASGLFDGSGDFIQTAGTSGAVSNTLGSTDFTVEAWVRPVLTGDRTIAAKRASGTSGWAWTIDSTGALRLRANINGTWSDTRMISATGLITGTTFQHVAWTHNGTAWTLWVDGASVATLTSAGGVNDSSAQVLRIGSATNAGENYYSGWIDEFRMTSGVCRYTAPFTPPTAAFPDV